MATLRTQLFGQTDQNLAPDQLTQLRVSDMSSLGRGYEAGRIGTDINAAAAQEATLRALAEQGDASAGADADALRGRIGSLQRRQALYAPEVGRVEDVSGVGSALSYAAGQVGQGVASMQDPLIAGTALQGAGRILGNGPGVLKAVGAGLRGAGYAVPFAMNQRQMTGEAYNAMVEDSALMGRTTATERATNANLYGAGAGMLDTVVPGMIAGKLTGAGLRQGVARSGLGARTLGGMAMEGGTELAQQVGQQGVLGYMNPDRDNAGDFSDNLNAFVGGAIGAGPMVMAGEMADSGHRRVGDTAQRVAAKTGETVDLLSEKIAPVAASAKDKLGKVVDLFQSGKAAGKVKDAFAGFEARAAERDVLGGLPPDDVDANDIEAYKEWYAKSAPKRMETVANRLGDLVEQGDEQAAAIYEQMGSTDSETRNNAYESGAAHILQQDEWVKVGQEVERRAQQASRLGTRFGKVAGKVTAAAAKGAVGLGKSIYDGVKSGMKKNAQGEDGGPDTSAARLMADYLAAEYDAAPRTPRGAEPAKLANYAKEIGYELADLADGWAAKSADTGRRVGRTFDGLKYNVNRLARSMHLLYGENAQQAVNELQAIRGNAAAGLFDTLRQELAEQGTPQRAVKYNQAIEREAQDAIVSALGRDVEVKLAEQGVNVRTSVGKAKLLSMVDAVDRGLATPEATRALTGLVGKDALIAMRRTLRPPQASQDDLVDDGGAVLGEGVAVNDDGEIDVAEQTNFDKALGETKAEKMRAAQMVRFGKSAMRLDPGAQGDVFAGGKVKREEYLKFEDEFLQRVAAGEPMKIPRAMQRPALVKKGAKLFSGEDAVENMVAQLEAEVGVDHSPEAMRASLQRDAAAARKAGDTEEFNRIVAQGKALRARMDANDPSLKAEARQFFADRSEGGKWGVRTVSVSDYMAEGKYDDARKLSLYRDYRRQELAAGADKMTPAERNEAMRELRDLGRAISDAVDQKDGKTAALRMSPAERRKALGDADKYFGERYMAVAEQATEAVPEQLTRGEIGVMAKLGDRIYERARLNKDQAALSEANVLVFKGTAKNDKGEPVPVRIPAKKLAGWGRAQREAFDSGTAEQGRKGEKDERFDDTVKDMQYLRDLSLGIMAVVDSGVVDAKTAPYKENQRGEAEYFDKSFAGELDGVPPSLALVTTTVFGLQKRGEVRRENRKEPSESEHRRKQLKDLKTKAKEWDDEPFVADPASERGSDTPEGFDDVRTRTKAQGRDARKMPLPEREIPMTAASRAEQRAERIIANFMPQARDAKLEATVDGVPKADASERYYDGVDAIMLRLRMAQRDKGDGGGAQYAIPVVVALSPENIARMDVTAAEAKNLADMRVTAMQIIAGSGLNKTLKAKFGAPVGEAPTKPKASEGGVSALLAAADKRLAYLTDPPADYTTEKARSIDTWADRALERVAERKAGTAKDDIANLEDLADAAAALKRLKAKAAEVIEGDASLSGFEGDAAPEVGARLGKPSGVGEASGTKYNAQDEQDGTARLISRRADERADKFRTFDAQRIYQADGGAFGAIKSTKRFFAAADGGTHTYVIPTELLTLLDQTADKYPDKSFSDILAVFAVQHTFYDRGSKAFQSFGPDPRTPAGKLLSAKGILGDTGKTFEHGVPVTRVEGVTRSQTVDFMADALAYARQIEGTPKVYVKWERTTGANIGKTFEGWLNAQQPTSKASTQAERDAAVAEIKKTLGDQITTRFEQTTGFSGAYLDQEAAIVISLTPAAGTLQTAYHEALHAFVARLVKGNEKAQRVLNSLANHQPTIERIHALLDGYPAAQAQLADGEERIAYAYQFWRAGLLDLPATQGAGMLQKLRKFFRGILGQISDLERASDVLGAFARGAYAGEPSVAGKVLAKTLSEGTWVPKTLRKMDGLVQKIAALTAPAQSLLLMSDSVTAQKLGSTFWTNPGDEGAGGEKEGYLNARERMAKRYTNEFSRIVGGLSERDHKDVIKLLQDEADPATIAYAPHRDAVVKIRALLQRFRTYMVDERGMKIGDRGPLYFPRVWSPHRLVEKKAEFLKMMQDNHPTYDAEAVYGAVLSKFEQNTEDSLHGREDDDAVLKPKQDAGNEMILSFITGAQAQPFLEQSLVGTLSRYFHEGARAAEYTARFGQTGRKLERALSMIHAELRAAGKKRRDDGEIADQNAETKWVERQMRDVNNAVSAMEGTLGRDVSDTWRKTNSWVTVYQNVRLLPMALFSSVVDPLGMMARGASMKEAYDGFLRGMSEVVKNWGEMITGEVKERKVDKWERMAMAVGSVDAAVWNHHVSDEYASVFMSAGAKKINDFMFRANGMEAWNRGMRVAATKSAAMFILRHKSLPDVHSERWLTEIGLTPADIHVDAGGDLITDKNVLAGQLGVTKEQAAVQVERVHMAINRWVQGAVLTPNAAQRPAWGSDPHYSMFFHLKQFAYSFHQTILKRAVNEMGHGNLAPMGAFVWYIPVMIASDITKGLIQGGGELPAHMKGMDLGDWVRHGAERSGLLSVGQLGVDAGQDVASIGGPAVEQIIDAYSDPLERTMIKAAPAHGLYAEAFK